MDKQMEKWAEEIAGLREQQKMTFKAIGEMYHISPGKVSYLYQDYLRRRRVARYREIHERQNQMSVSVSMTLGETVVLQRILTLYQIWALRESSRWDKKGNPLFQEPDCVTAEYLNRRLSELERKKRKGAQEDELLPTKTIDISESD